MPINEALVIKELTAPSDYIGKFLSYKVLEQQYQLPMQMLLVSEHYTKRKRNLTSLFVRTTKKSNQFQCLQEIESFDYQALEVKITDIFYLMVLLQERVQ